MLKTKGWAARTKTSPLEPFEFERRDLRDDDILIQIDYCGVCHSDIHQARDEWGGSIYPMVPGHEIVGHVAKVGSKVTGFKVGDLAGVGCMVDSCLQCPECQRDLEQYCQVGNIPTYNGYELDRKTMTFGGYSNQLVVKERFALHVPASLDLAAVAPLLCAGITTYSPLRHWNCKKGDQVAVVGLGGLGHMAVKLAAAMGAEVTLLSTSPSKEADAKRLGAHHFVVTKDPAVFRKLSGRFDLMIDCVSAQHDLNAYLSTLKVDGVLVQVGAPPAPSPVHAFSLIPKRRTLAGSMIGGIKETQEMLDFCAEHRIVSDIELIPMQKINEAYERTIKSDVRYRFVIDMKSL